ncbi:MAG: DUF72 domain-containing protein [Syntrophorhabdaceae bacterium]
MKLYVGTSGYAYRAWKGTFYPDDIPGDGMLRFYARHFNTVEINNTFYRMPTPRVLKSWINDVPSRFLFALKAPRRITHRKALNEIGRDVHYLFQVASTLGSHLGPILFQFPKSVGTDPERLEPILDLMPEDYRCAFEFRGSPPGDAMLRLIAGKGCVLCITDTSEQPVEDIEGRTPWGYIRLRRPDYTGEDLIKWHRMIAAQGWDRTFVFFKHEELGLGPQMAVHLNEIVRTQTLPD